ncbi:uncharacterized protein LOC134101090 [Sardina pilchardus]|uniref:uncharacterized protein LOC134101090 n=1 Tax=Sardina pilchardus TaxID=27697 RepID=UPI002E0D1638
MLSDVSTEVISTDSVTDLRQEEMVITLLKHYQSMKRRETRIRLATGFMILLGFAAVFFFHYQTHSASDEAGIAAQHEPSAQAQRHARRKHRPSFYLTPAMNQTQNMRPMLWLNRNTLQTVQSIHIPMDGLYFVFLQMAYRIPEKFCGEEMANKEITLVSRVILTSKVYPKPRTVVSSKDSIFCRPTYPNFRSVYTGRSIMLMDNDTLEVTVHTPELIDRNTKEGLFFGGYLINKSKDRI